MLFILFAIGKKFSFPIFFQLRYCELVAWQLRVFDGCFHANYIAWQLKLNHWFRSNQKTYSLITIGTPPLNSLKPKLHVTYTVLLIKTHSRNLFNLITIGTLPLSKNLCYLQHFNVYCQHRIVQPSREFVNFVARWVSLFLILQPFIFLVPKFFP